jgi:hypothetical protein
MNHYHEKMLESNPLRLQQRLYIVMVFNSYLLQS